MCVRITRALNGPSTVMVCCSTARQPTQTVNTRPQRLLSIVLNCCSWVFTERVCFTWMRVTISHSTMSKARYRKLHQNSRDAAEPHGASQRDSSSPTALAQPSLACGSSSGGKKSTMPVTSLMHERSW